MGTYTVEQAAKKMDKPDKGYGPMMVVSLMLKDEQGAVTAADWFTKATTPIPASGSQLQGDLTNGQYGWTFKKTSAGSFGGGGRGGPMDPKDAARMRYMAAWKNAQIYAANKLNAGVIQDYSVDDIAKIAKEIERHFKQAETQG